jgi:hypothetical protein
VRHKTTCMANGNITSRHARYVVTLQSEHLVICVAHHSCAALQVRVAHAGWRPQTGSIGMAAIWHRTTLHGPSRPRRRCWATASSGLCAL